MRRLFCFSLVVSVSVALGLLLVPSFESESVCADGTLGQGGATLGNGDVNGDNALDLSDAIFLLTHLFQGGPAPVPCPGGGGGAIAGGQGGATLGNGDVNGDNALDLSDAIFLLAHLFQGGPAPVPCPNLGPETNCTDNIDDDLDGDTDCDDDDCQADPFCVPSPLIPGFTSLGRNAEGYPEYTYDLTGMVFVLLPGGTFEMGSPASEEFRDDDEGPQHNVTLDSFLIAKYEVNQAQYEAVMTGHLTLSATPNEQDQGDPPSIGADLPVGFVSMNDLEVPDNFLHRTGLLLPTEAEWEYACRAGQPGPYSGTGVLNEMGWWRDISGAFPQAVGQLQANQFGLHDMHGNAWEPCRDEFGDYTLPVNPGDGLRQASGSGARVIRGGSYSGQPEDARSANRVVEPADSGFASNGFRPVLPLDQEICIGGVDNDGDGDTDCDDSDCDGNPLCQQFVMVCDPGAPAPDLTTAGFSFVRTSVDTGCHEYVHDLPAAGGGGGAPIATNMEFVLLPGGAFEMGSPDTEVGHDITESPLHNVTLDSFLISKTEVKQAQYEAVMAGHASLSATPNAAGDPATVGDDLPVGFVSWDDLNDGDGFLARTGLVLPTEARWEYAARSGTSGSYGGTGFLDNMGWYAGNSGDALQDVNTQGGNQFGLHDMHGNVWEWCRDNLGAYTLDVNAGDGERQAPDAGFKVVRGGSFASDAVNCRSAVRGSDLTNASNGGTGFRLAAPVP